MKPFLKYTGYILLIILAGFLFYRFYFIGIWILIAAVVSFVGQPIAQFVDRLHFRKMRLPHSISAFLALLVMVLIFFGFIGIFVPLVLNQANTLAEIDVEKLTQNLETPFQSLDHKLHNAGIISEDQSLQNFILERAKTLVGLENIGSVLTGFIGIAGNIFVGIFSIFFISFFFIKDENMFEDNILLLVPEKHHESTHSVINDSKVLLKRYFIGILLEVVGVITLITIGLWILGIENALLIGLFSGIMNIIPYLGPIIGSALGLILGITGSLASGNYDILLPSVLKMISVFTIVQVIDNNILVPMIYAKSVKSHPLEIFLIIVMGGSLAGLPGMLLAVPVYTVLRIIAREFLQQFRVVQKLTESIDNK